LGETPLVNKLEQLEKEKCGKRKVDDLSNVGTQAARDVKVEVNRVKRETAINGLS